MPSGNEFSSRLRFLWVLAAGAAAALIASSCGSGGSVSSYDGFIFPVGCAAVTGGLSLSAGAVRASGVSPLTVFFDATASSSSATAKPFSHIRYRWDFGDAGASGTGKWAYGSNPGRNSMNTATGAVAAHVYQTPGTDQVYTVTLTASDGTNSASCQMGVTAYDPSGSSGYPGSATTCVSSSGVPVAGLGGCPLGAAVLNTSSFVTALGSPYMGNGKRVLFKCGDTFSGANAKITAVDVSIGAYGGCEGTTSNRPILRKSGAATAVRRCHGGDCVSPTWSWTDRATPAAGSQPPERCWRQQHMPYQVTILNVAARTWPVLRVDRPAVGVGQFGLVDPPNNCIGTFANYAANSPTHNGTIPNIFYTAIMGNSFDGARPPQAPMRWFASPTCARA